MTTSTTQGAQSMAARLRSETRSQHSDAESHPFQRALLTGDIARDTYALWLIQMLHVHQALEAAIRAQESCDATLAAVVTEEQMQEQYLLEDLAFFSVSANDESLLLDATGAVVSEIEADADSPARLLGRHYVLEGSNNGSRFIARKVREKLTLAPGAGDRYLDPYGQEQPVKWAAFKKALDACDIAPAVRDDMVDAAKCMFIGVRQMSDAMLDRYAH